MSDGLEILSYLLAGFALVIITYIILWFAEESGRWKNTRSPRTESSWSKGNMWGSQSQGSQERRRDAWTQQAVADWRQKYDFVVFSPTQSHYYGDLSQRDNSVGIDDGVIGAADGKIIFASRKSSTFELSFPFAILHQLSHPDTTAHPRMKHYYSFAGHLTIHCERADRWHIHLFDLAFLPAFITALEPFGLSLAEGDYDLGPIQALRLEQNIYGHWETKHTTTLYLTPDRVLYDWRTAIHFAQLRGVGIMLRPGPLGKQFLRVDYINENNSPHSVGFEMSTENVYRWAQHLERVANLHAVTYSARKGKVD
ncbi:MAG: hypothetical protein HY866_07605 [Chloroflexi bacterium]|nr:hypothetical protein [Chloroflexota bacterium]